MSSNTDPDRQLRQFLQKYHPSVPPASPGLESQLFQQITPRSSGFTAVTKPKSAKKINLRWLSGGLILMGMVISGGITWRLQSQTAFTPTSPEILEAFLEDSWTGAIAVTEEAEWVEVQTELTSPSQEWWQLTRSTANHSAD